METLFVQQSEDALKQFGELFTQQNWKQIGLLAHKIKASIDMLQITPLKQPIRQLEALGKQEKESPEIANLINLTTEILMKVCDEIKLSHQ